MLSLNIGKVDPKIVLKTIRNKHQFNIFSNKVGMLFRKILKDCKTARLQNCKTAKLQDCKTIRLQDCKTAKLQDCKTTRLQNYK